MTALTLEMRDFAIRSIGCVACRLFGAGFCGCEKHHLNEGDTPGRARRGEKETVGLCRWHHVGACLCAGKLGVVRDCAVCFKRRGPSWWHRKRAFLLTFGTGDELLVVQNNLIADFYRKPYA